MLFGGRVGIRSGWSTFRWTGRGTDIRGSRGGHLVAGLREDASLSQVDNETFEWGSFPLSAAEHLSTALTTESFSHSTSVLHAKLLSCVWLYNPMGCSPPGSSVPGILQAKILEGVAMPFSRGSSWPRGWTWVSYVSCIGSWVLYH